MKYKRYIFGAIYLLVLFFPVLWGAFSTPHSRVATVNIIEASGTTPLNTDIAFYPFEVGTGVRMKGYALENNALKPISNYPRIGYKGSVELSVLKPLFEHYSFASFFELEEKLGQYYHYYNYDGTPICIFFKHPSTLTVAINQEEHVKIISEEFSSSYLSPEASTIDGDDFIVLLRDQTNFVVKTIGLDDQSVSTHAFYLKNTSSEYYSLLGMAFEDNHVYLLMNELARHSNAQRDAITPGYVGAYMITYSLDTKEITYTKVHPQKLDFFARDKEHLLFGSLEDQKRLSITKYSLESGEQEISSIQLPTDSNPVSCQSSFYKDGYLYIHLLDHATTKETTNHLYMIDLPSSKILNHYTYQYKGDLFMRYYQPGTSYMYDELYSTTN